MIALVAPLGASLAIEAVAAGSACWRTSISSHYYTPVRGVFIGALVAIGVCLITIKGNTPRQDILLNIGGMLSPVVAFVPIQDPHECTSAVSAATVAGPNISNNVDALLIAGAIAMFIVIVLAGKAAAAGRLDRNSVVGIVLVLVVAVIGVGFFFLARPTVEQWAHYGAAIPLFIILMAVMVTDAMSYGRSRANQQGRPAQRSDYANRYLFLAVVLGVSVVGLLLVRWLLGWDHAVLWVEIDVIVLFAAFGALQTGELWPERSGLRDDPQGTRAAS